jgi:GT2 family glycosyltransferase
MAEARPQSPACRVQVQVVLYRSSRWLGKLASGLARLAEGGPQFTTLIWDNEPSAQAADFAGQQGWTYVASPDGNLGFGRAHNALSALASPEREFLLLLNPDAVPFYDSLNALVRTADHDPSAALLEAVQVPVEHPKIYDPATLETSWCSGACLLVRRSVFEALGGFDPEFFLYAEDVDLSWRVWLAGRRCLYVVGARCLHVTETYDLGKLLRTEVLQQAVSALCLRRKYFGEAEVDAYKKELNSTLPPRLTAEVLTAFDRCRVTPLGRWSNPHISLEGGGLYGQRRW